MSSHLAPALTRHVVDVEQDTVVVGVDGSADGRRALRYASREAGLRGHGLRIVHVRPDGVDFSKTPHYLPDGILADTGGEVLEEARQAALDWGIDPTRLTTELLGGARSSALVHSLDRASAIVLGTRHSELAQLFTGSTSAAVAAASPVPVHLVPQSWVRTDDRKVIAVGVDGSLTTPDLVTHAFAEARLRAARVIIVHAWQHARNIPPAQPSSTSAEEWVRGARDWLTSLTAGVVAAHPDVPWSLELPLVRPVTAMALAGERADLLVLGRRGAGGSLELALGYLPRVMLRKARCPVMVVPVSRHRGHGAPLVGRQYHVAHR